ncbi:MAG: ATP-binding protein [Candidatus Hinthialibacter antarcticus]|nr:ATP-binding protein [Candidatus Hinthialibacter antarcticus]
MPQLPPEDITLQRQRLEWLIGLRWYGAASVIASALIGNFVFGLHFSLTALFAIAFFMFAYNAYYAFQLKRPKWGRSMALQQIVLDVLSLTLILLMTGGFINPFFTFFFFQVIIAWIMLPPRQSVAIIGLIFFCFAIQVFAPSLVSVDMNLSEDGILGLGKIPFHVVGAPISFVATTLMTAYFVSVIMGDLRRREGELLQAHQRVELEFNKLDNLLRRLEAGMLVMSANGQVEWTNDKVREWFGPDAPNADYRICAGAFQALHEISTKNDLEQSTLYREVRLPTQNDGVRNFDTMVTPIINDSGELVQIIKLILDVTDQKKRKEQWARAEKLAAIGQLAAGVAHEINTPLGTIRILAEEARDILSHLEPQGKDSTELDDALQTIHEQTTRCKNITQGLLNYSRITEPTLQPCPVNPLVSQALEITRHKINGIQIHQRLQDDLPDIVTDANRIQQALCNLIINAADAMDETSQPEMQIETQQVDDTISIRVTDNGPGISHENLPHIFEPFFTTKPVGKGTGLGLYITYGSLRELGGRLEIESEPGVGTQAAITLPINHE